MTDTSDEIFMRAALEEARKGRYIAPPNPAVGCVIVKDGQIVSRGYTHAPGSQHAEIDAITGRRLFPQCRHRHRSGTPDRMVSGYLLESALLGLQRLSFSFSWLYLPVRGGRFRHRGCALDLCAGGAAHQALETSHPQSAPWIKHPASAALCRRLRSCAHFSKPRSRHYLPLR